MNCEKCGERMICKPSGGYKCFKCSPALYGPERVREFVRIRDNHTCQEEHGGCGRVWDGKERRFDIHHLDGICGRMSRSYDKLGSMDGLTTLCHKCHLSLPEVIDKMKNHSSPRPGKHR